MIDTIRKRFEESAAVLLKSCEKLSSRLAEAAGIIISAYHDGRGVFIFGNGGSAADAQHIAAELVGRYLKERRALKAFALTTDTSILTAIGNDYSFDKIFTRQLEAAAQSGDVAIALSTSGNSPNVVSALSKAREMGMKTIAFTSQGGGKCAEHADVLLDVPSTDTPCVQESHMVIYHTLCELIDKEFAKS